MQVLSELTIPFLKVGGQLIALKAAAADEELADAKNALNLLFAKPVLNENYKLPNGDGRNITIVDKKKKPQISTHVVLGCLTRSRYNVYPRMFLVSLTIIYSYDNSEVFIDKSSFLSRKKLVLSFCLCHYSGEYFT